MLAIALPTALGLALSGCTSPKSGENMEPQNASPAKSQTEITPTESPSQPIPDKAAQTTATQPSPNASPSLSPDRKTPSTDPTAAPAHKLNQSKSTKIRIDETVCGAGGQEAYFETKTQEIYICKNEAAALTYIATPKKKGNSLFLPAQKVQQGNVVGYAAIEKAKTYIVTSNSFQIQDNGKLARSEKVIRRQLAGN